jgi:Predicted thioesterase
VNNAHYVEWALECLPDAWIETRRVRELDIVYRAAARWGDTVGSEAARENADTLLHGIRRASDGMLLASAKTVWSCG